MTISKKLLLITILNIPIVFNTFTQNTSSDLNIIKNYASALHNQDQSTKNNAKIAHWLERKLKWLSWDCPHYRGLAKQVESFPLCTCDQLELPGYEKEEISALALVIQNYPDTREKILKTLMMDEKARRELIRTKIMLYNAREELDDNAYIVSHDYRPRWLKDNLIEYMTGDLSDDESCFIDH